jgi:hypothetical protein
MGTNTDFVNKMAQGAGEGAEGRAQAKALTELSKLKQEEVTSEAIRMTNKVGPDKMIGYANSEFIAAAKSGNTTRLRAAQSILMKTSKGREEMHKTLAENVEGAMSAINSNAEMSKEFKNDLNAAGLKSSDAGLARLGYEKGTGDNPVTLAEIDAAGLAYSLTDAEIIGQSDEGIVRAIRAGQLTAETATRILASDTIKTNEDQRRILIDEAHGTLPHQQSSSNGPTYPNSGTGTIGFGQGNGPKP